MHTILKIKIPVAKPLYRVSHRHAKYLNKHITREGGIPAKHRTHTQTQTDTHTRIYIYITFLNFSINKCMELVKHHVVNASILQNHDIIPPPIIHPQVSLDKNQTNNLLFLKPTSIKTNRNGPRLPSEFGAKIYVRATHS